MHPLVMSPAPGQRLVRHVGDTIRFSLTPRDPALVSLSGWHARLRTNLGRGLALRQEVVQAHTDRVPPFGASWHDLRLIPQGGSWSREFVLTEPGFYDAKAYATSPDGYQHWPEGPDFGVSVHPDWCRTANTVYCAFTRLFGTTRFHLRHLPEPTEALVRDLEHQGFAVLPPSGTFRDLARQLPHIVQRLGCRILHLLPVHPTPTVHARFGRMGSPYAALDLTAVDPALVEFDHRTRGVEQFVELTRTAHHLGARVFIDIVINHTGWGSRLYEEHPEFFRREPDGRFASPGAWGTVWEDLVELEQKSVELWDIIADALLTWCRRGVDGFRCDAGYKIPSHVWQYITARVSAEFPETVYLLEGLGGSWDATETLLGPGGMQWAYSELFQNHSASQVQSYLDYALQQSTRAGTYIHYSETHDNDRLAAQGRAWSVLRNRLCALVSVKGGYGITCGVEWLAAEKILVHQRSGLAWDAGDNIVPEIAALNRLLAEHPAFFDDATLTRLSEPADAALALERTSGDGRSRCLVLVNPTLDAAATLELPASHLPPGCRTGHDLLGQPGPSMTAVPRNRLRFVLAPGAAYCLGDPLPAIDAGTRYREQRSLTSWALRTATMLVPAEQLTQLEPAAVADSVRQDPVRWLGAVSAQAAALPANSDTPGFDLRRTVELAADPETFPSVIVWRAADARRIVVVPPGWWLVISLPEDFRAHLKGLPQFPAEHATSIRADRRSVACFAPRGEAATHEAQLTCEHADSSTSTLHGAILFLEQAASPAPPILPHPDDLLLLTNGRGGMARLRVDFGSTRSKYDCALAANLHPTTPVDRHVLVKRVRAWLNADDFISPINQANLTACHAGLSPTWHFRANAGNGRTVSLQVRAEMLRERNTTRFTFSRSPNDEPHRASLTLRVDLEDRSFHGETHRDPGADRHFQSHVHTTSNPIGFAFTPAADRGLRVAVDQGRYHDQPEWSERIPHPEEAVRGQIAEGDAYSPGWFEIPLAPGAQAVLELDAESTPAPPHESPAAPPPATTSAGFADRLRTAAQAFLVRRDHGRTVIAGYPWFLDWGRDTLIACRGLLAGGWEKEVLEILEVFGRFADRGTLPNSIHGENASNRDTIDAALWYGIAVEDAVTLHGEELLHHRIPDTRLTLLEVVRSLAEGCLAGTPNGIRVDPESHLLWSPSHFTWMDTNHPAGTPREGYPVEVQALWIRLIRFLARMDPEAAGRWGPLAAQAQASFERLFWLPQQGWFSDVLLASSGVPAPAATPDTALRCNALFAVTLGLATPAQARATVGAAFAHLLVPGAIRSLAPLPVTPPLPIHGANGQLLNDPARPYWGRYEGDEDTRRKPAYHNGTAWTWILPTFCEALALAWDRRPEAVRAAAALLTTSASLLNCGCLGQLPEIRDGDAPHQDRGCDAQAWSVTEALRVWHWLHP